ncbi:hypothetical protein N9Z18_02285 [Verrucomicrobiales bacterium]|jgi:hypothetical protein|nr:hypothetical protein [Verrucomicrobiales bacterium]
MKFCRLIFLGSLLIVLLTTVGKAEEVSLTPLGTWSWSQASFSTAEARDSMLDFCGKESISHIDQHISIASTKTGYVIKNAEALAALLVDATKRGISINALRGERDMFFAKNHERALEHLKALIAFNNELPKEARFAGIKYDVEPYLTPEWKAGGGARENVILDYLAFLREARSIIDAEAPEIELCADIPFWWEKPEFACDVNGKSQLLIHHIIDLTDWIGIMSYRRSSAEVLRLTKEEFDYAEKISKSDSIAPAINTMTITGAEEHTSFGGLSVEELRETISELRASLSNVGAARFLMVHDYKNFMKFLETAPEARAEE